jgi:hypothetical protein
MHSRPTRGRHQKQLLWPHYCRTKTHRVYRPNRPPPTYIIRGQNYLLIAHHHDSNAIENRRAEALTEDIKSIHDTLIKCYNECPKQVKEKKQDGRLVPIDTFR